MVWLIVLGIIVVIILASGIKVVYEYERGVRFTLGKLSGIMESGLRFVIPIIQTYQKVDIRVKTVDVPDQEAMTGDNISVTINAVIYYKVRDAKRAIVEVQDFYYAISQLAQTTMRNIVGEFDLDSLLSNREQVSNKIEEIVDKATDPWGIEVVSVELKDIVLPQDMKRVIGRQAEAERERRAVIIKSEGEVKASENLAKAAETLTASNGSLHLRTLHTLNDLSGDQSNTVIFAVPIEVLRAFESMSGGPVRDMVDSIAKKVKKAKR
ncbi:MAG: slipin family protein [Nanoarchaeota archaeon]